MNSDDEEIVLETDDVVDDIVDETEQVNDDEEKQHEPTDEIDAYDNETNIDFNEIETPEINVSEEVIVDADKRTSKNKMTRYEFVRIIGERIMQLTKGAKPLIKQNKQSLELSYKEIAIEELKANIIPFKIRRFVKDHYEIWKIGELNKKHLEPLFY